MNIKSYIAASVVASISISASSVAMADDTYYLKSDCPAGGKRNFYLANGKDVNPDAVDKYGFARCNCVSYVADKIAKTSDSNFKNNMSGKYEDRWGSASNWKTVAAKHGYITDSEAKKGDIAWFDYNHVAYVESVNDDGSVNISEYNNPNGGFTYAERKANAKLYIRKGNGSTTATLSSVGVTCPSSVWDFDSSAGTCNATAYYSDNSNKSVKASSWGNSNSTAASINNGAISTKDVSKDTTVQFTASYTEGSVSKTSSSALVSIKDLPDKSDPEVFCKPNGKSDAITYDTQTVYNKSKVAIGEVQLRYSPSCKAAWGKISLEKASNKKPQSVITTSRTRSNIITSIASDKRTGEVYSNLALLRIAGDKVCALGTIDGFSPSKAPCKSF